MSDVDSNDLQLVLLALFPETLLTTVEETAAAFGGMLIEVLDVVFNGEFEFAA